MLLSDLKNEMKKVIQGNPSAVLSVVLTWLCERRPSILSLATRGVWLVDSNGFCRCE